MAIFKDIKSKELHNWIKMQLNLDERLIQPNQQKCPPTNLTWGKVLQRDL